ncbi:MAG TPA: PHP domain-containing protein [Syntrophomonas sp.]|nr:PHP domain-containing protein [Syntrophomonas sp.]
MMRCEYDLHVHSTYSDGTLSPPALLAQTMEIGLTGISITDHDTLDGLQETLAYIADHTIKIDYIPGVELNTEPEEEGNEIHILGYYIAHENRGFHQRLAEIREQRKNRAIKIVEKLNALGCKLDFANVSRQAGSDLIGRPHIAMAMVEAGYAKSMAEVFEQYIGYGRPAYVRRYKFPPGEAIELIKSSGGIAVLAHPGLIKNQALIGNLIKAGIEGVETYYPQHTEQQTTAYLKLAEEHKLLITGGSDYHGPGSSESRAHLGGSGIDSVLMAKLKAYKYK